MSLDRADNDQHPKRRLSEAIRDVKNAAADREDVVVELREATRMRLQLLAAELAPIVAEVPPGIELFDFAVSSGLQPRLWIDSVAHVAMGRDRRTYRFVKDTRNGRIVLAETPKIEAVAAQVTRYVAERIVEREQQIEGDVEASADVAPAEDGTRAPASVPRKARKTWASLMSGLLVFLSGVGFGLAIAISLLWERLTATMQ